MLSVTHNAFDMIEEVRRQFREEPGILAGTQNRIMRVVSVWLRKAPCLL